MFGNRVIIIKKNIKNIPEFNTVFLNRRVAIHLPDKSKCIAGSTNIKCTNFIDTIFTKINRYYSYFFLLCITKYENF
jgi:hypothetical protein